MRLQIAADGITITPKRKEFIHEKLDRDLEQYLPDLNEELKTADVKITKRTRWGFKVNFNMSLPEKYNIYAEEKGESLQSTIILLRDDLIRLLKRYKARISD